MPITSRSEFEAVANHVVIRIQKVLVERGDAPKLETARDDIQRLSEIARDAAKLKAFRSKLDQVTDVISAEIPSDSALLDDLWDLMDYIDYRV